MTYTPEQIEERKAHSLLRYKTRAEKEQNIKDGRKFFAEHNLPLLVSYPSDRPIGVYMTFMPVGKDKLQVAVALRSKKDNESFRKARGILGHRMKNNFETFMVFPANKRTDRGGFTTKDGGWRFADLYKAFDTIIPAELMLMEKTPTWMKRILMMSNHPLAFMDYRLVRHIDAKWPGEAVRIAQRYYEKSWPEPLP